MTEALARMSARRPWVTVGVWAVLVVIGGFLSALLLDTATTTELRLSGGLESERAARLLEERLRGPDPLTEIVIVQSESLTVDDPAFRATVESLFDSMIALGPGVIQGAQHYYLDGDASLVSADRRTTLIPLVMTGDLGEAEANVEHLLEIVEKADEAEDFRALMGGTASISFESNELAQEDLEQGERFGIPVALIILLALFGAVVAALVPLGLAIVAIVIALGLVSLIGQGFELVFFVTMMVTMIGLAVGIDYSLIMVSRFRDEMNRGLGKAEAVLRTGDTAGRTVLFSGFTVVIALCGMLIVPQSFFQSMAIGAILVVTVAVAAVLTLLPAVLSLLGPRVNLLRVPFTGKKTLNSSQETRDATETPRGFWELTTRVVTRFPIISILVIGAPMVALATFYFDIELGLNGVDVFPEGAQTREAFFVLEEQFSFGLIDPAEIVISGDIDSPPVQEAIQRLQASLAEDSRFPVPPTLAVNADRDLALLTVIIPGEPRSPGALALLRVIREDYILEAFDGVPATVLVGGVTAIVADLFTVVDRYTPIVFAFVLGFSFISLTLVFRSIVVPVKAVIMNLLSVGAAYGMLVLVFQRGIGADLLGFQQAEVIDAWIPLFLFSILFGLSMDYHVFLLSRIRERYDQTGDNTEAVAYGLRSTTGIITGAALIMVAVFGAFAAGETIINQQVGFGLAVAIFLDATLVRSVLVPASMELLGRRNWYLPSFLRWIPDLRVEPSDASPVEKGTEP